MTRREHIEQLAAEMDASLDYTGERYRMHVNLPTRMVTLAPWDSDVPETELYWVALHELGHLAVFDASGDEVKLLFPWQEADDEARAWVWAIDNSVFPFDQAAESSIAWGLADRIHLNGFEPSAALQRIFELIGPEPDWYFNVTTPQHYRKLNGYAIPAWRKLAARYEATPSDGADARRGAPAASRPRAGRTA